MATDYYPRLASVAADRDLCNRVINQQAEIAVLILGLFNSVFSLH
jgi:hypothetical protein